MKKIGFKDFYLNHIFFKWSPITEHFQFFQKTFLNLIFVLDLLKIQLKGPLKKVKKSNKSSQKVLKIDFRAAGAQHPLQRP